MKKAFLYSSFILCLAACQREIIPPPTPDQPVTDLPIVPEPKDTVPCTPFLMQTTVQLDRWHKDSAILQLPCAYNADTTKTYPLLVFLNGVFEGSKYGTLRKLMKLGPPRFMADSLRFAFTVNGKEESMIVVCPQSTQGYRSPLSINQVIDYMIAHYRIDTTRLYLTGLSAGANSVLRYLAHRPQYTARIAAAVPMSTTLLDSVHVSQLNYISDARLPLWWFCGDADKKYLKANKKYVKRLNDLAPGLVQFTLYKGEHKGWNPMYNPGHRFYNPNMYEWLLQHKR